VRILRAPVPPAPTFCHFMAGGALQQHHHDKGKVIARVFEIKDSNS
jgi:hypothetical protein